MGNARIFDIGRPLIMAHRGDPSTAPENSRASMESALDVGVDFLETDVRMTKDEHLILFHDDELMRTTGKAGKVQDYSLDELRELDIGYNYTIDGTSFPFRGRGHHVITIEEAFETYPEAKFTVDIKDSDPRAPALLARVIVDSDRQDSVIVASFKPPQMKRFRDLVPNALTSAHPGEVRNFVLGVRLRAVGKLVKRIHFRAFHVPVNFGPLRVVSSKFVEEAHKRDVAVQVWTINDREEMERLIDLGVDGIFTDEPMLLRKVLSERGLL
ncbi:MAG: glycerophosphodiester phosphodiesterase [Candidatus Thorarchaeota archaeon]